MNRRYMNCIVICKEGDQLTKAAKYHDIMNVESRILAFIRFVKGNPDLPGAEYINFYYKPENEHEKGRNYAFRRYIE